MGILRIWGHISHSLKKGFMFNSLQSVVEKPPVGGKELLPLPSHALSGFRLNPGPVSNRISCTCDHTDTSIVQLMNNFKMKTKLQPNVHVHLSCKFCLINHSSFLHI